MSKKQLLHFDSINATQITDTALNSSTPFKCYWTLKNPIKKIKSLSLKSVELPILFYNVRSSNSTNTFTFTFTYSSWTNQAVTVTITESNYTITTLLSALNTAISTAITSYSGLTLTISNNSTTNKLYFTTNASSMSFNSSQLITNMLGFTSGSQTISASSIYSSGVYNVNLDNYLNMYFYNIPNESTNVNGFNSTFKVPCNATFQQVLYVNENSNFKQLISLKDDYFVLNALYVQIYDRFGYSLNPNNGNYSFTLEITYD